LAILTIVTFFGIPHGKDNGLLGFILSCFLRIISSFICALCIWQIVALTYHKSMLSPQVEESLVASIADITKDIGVLEEMVKVSRVTYKGMSTLHALASLDNQENKQGKQQQVAADALGALCQLGRIVLHFQPRIMLPYPAFRDLIRCAIGEHFSSCSRKLFQRLYTLSFHIVGSHGSASLLFMAKVTV